MNGRFLRFAVRKTEHGTELRNDSSSAQNSRFVLSRGVERRRPAVKSFGEIDEKRQSGSDFTFGDIRDVLARFVQRALRPRTIDVATVNGPGTVSKIPPSSVYTDSARGHQIGDATPESLYRLRPNHELAVL